MPVYIMDVLYKTGVKPTMDITSVVVDRYNYSKIKKYSKINDSRTCFTFFTTILMLSKVFIGR